MEKVTSLYNNKTLLIPTNVVVVLITEQLFYCSGDYIPKQLFWEKVPDNIQSYQNIGMNGMINYFDDDESESLNKRYNNEDDQNGNNLNYNMLIKIKESTKT